MAEDTGLIVPIGAWVVRKPAARPPAGPSTSASQSTSRRCSSIAARSTRPSCSRWPTAGSRRPGSRSRSPNRSSSRQRGDAAAAHSLRSLGVRVALDDFGTGYSSLSYLQSFPFDKLKIDRSFIHNLLTRDGASAIVRAITELAHALNIETTAEGVEETAQLMELRAHGCSSVQGFLFAEPMTAADVDRLFRKTGRQFKTSPDRCRGR